MRGERKKRKKKKKQKQQKKKKKQTGMEVWHVLSQDAYLWVVALAAVSHHFYSFQPHIRLVYTTKSRSTKFLILGHNHRSRREEYFFFCFIRFYFRMRPI